MPNVHPSAIERVILDPFTDEDIPEYQRVALAFLAGYRVATTRTNYGQSLRYFFEWCHSRGLEPLRGIKRPHIELWLRIQEDQQGLAPRTINGRCIALGQYYRYACMEGYIESSPMAWVKRPRIDRKTSSNHLTGPELGRFIEKASVTRVRDEAIFCLLGYNGIRVGELCSLNVEDIHHDKGFTTIKFIRKGGAMQMLPLAQRTAWALSRYVGDRTEGALFVSLRDPSKRLDRNAVGNLVKSYCKQLGITKRITPHSFRHSFITLALDAGVSQREVQRDAGHADARMVQYYDHGSSGFGKSATFGVAAWVEGMI